MRFDYEAVTHQGVRALAAYVPGKSVEALHKELGLQDIIKLASNENPLGCSVRVAERLKAISPQCIARYPISSQSPLIDRIAEKYQLEPAQITLGNGSDMLFQLLLNCFALEKNLPILIPQYSFSMYAIFAQSMGIAVKTIPLGVDWQVDVDALIAAAHQGCSMIFLANPNNPTGYRLPQIEIQRLLQQIPQETLLVLDEAYYEFSATAEGPSSLSLLAQHPNLAITRTFSKAYGLAALRVGYALTAPGLAAVLRKVQAAFTVNLFGLEAAAEALADQEFIQRTLENNQLGLEQLSAAFDPMGIPYLPINGNFITINCGQDAMPLYQGLLQRGIIVRPLHPYGLDAFLRISVGLPEQNASFIHHFKELIHEHRSK